jgi:hypothetical protein
MNTEKLIKKCLWLLFYTQSGLPMQVQAFYARDEEDANSQVKHFFENITLPIYEHYFQPALQGFILHHASLRGIVHERTDGSLVEGTWYE